MNLYGFRVSQQSRLPTTVRLSKTCKAFVDHYDYHPGSAFVADETYIKVRGIKSYIWFIMDAVSRSIIGYWHPPAAVSGHVSWPCGWPSGIWGMFSPKALNSLLMDTAPTLWPPSSSPQVRRKDEIRDYPGHRTNQQRCRHKRSTARTNS